MEKLQDFWNNILTRFDSEESIIFTALMIGAFLIGLLLGWLIHGTRARRRRREIERLQNELADWRVKYAKVQEELELKDADLIRANREVDEWSQTVKELYSERDQLRAQLTAAQRDNEQYDASASGYIQTIEDLNNQIIGLKARVQQTGDSGGASYGGGRISTDNSAEVGDLRTKYDVAMDRIQRLEARMEALHANDGQQDSGTTVTRGRGIENEPPIVAAASLPPLETTDFPTSSTDDEDDVLFDDRATSRGGLTDRLGGKVPAPIAVDGDDLTKIEGVGPFLARQLNEVGVYHYEQIAGWSDGEIERITTAIGHFPGRIQRDDWVGQAEGLAKQRDEADNDELIGDASDGIATMEGEHAGSSGYGNNYVSSEDLTEAIISNNEAETEGAYGATDEEGLLSFGVAATTDEKDSSSDDGDRIELISKRGMQAETNNSDDLKIVEGIGPKIEELLKNNGITDIKTLSETPYEQLRKVLDDAGSRFKMHDPMTWPTQAALAYVGKWRQLDELQEKLKGGRDV